MTYSPVKLVANPMVFSLVTEKIRAALATIFEDLIKTELTYYRSGR